MNRYLEKLAYLKLTAIGAGLGALYGAGSGYTITRNDNDKTFTKKERRVNAFKGGIKGAVAGGILGASFHHDHIRGAGRSNWELKQLHKSLGTKGFKTKAEATLHYRRAAKKYHPDLHGGNGSKMSDLNTAWDKYKSHPHGFEKLAGIANKFLR